MSRPSKSGLEYFPLDTVMDDNFACIEAKYGLSGFAILIKLYQKIYFENGYFYPWGEKEQLLFSANTKTPIEQLNLVISDAISFGIFNKEMFDKKQVLTSHGIQKRYFSVCKRKKQLLIYDDLLLINIDFLTDSDVNVVIKTYKCEHNVCNIDALCEHNVCKSTEKEIGNKKRKYGNIEKGDIRPPIPPMGDESVSAQKPISKKSDYSEDFLAFYEQYPRKEEKKQAAKTYNARVKEGARQEDILLAVSNYKRQIADRHTGIQYVKMPSTFLNCYQDFMQYIPPSSGPPLPCASRNSLDMAEG